MPAGPASPRGMVKFSVVVPFAVLAETLALPPGALVVVVPATTLAIPLVFALTVSG